MTDPWLLRDYQLTAVDRGTRFLREGLVQGGLIVLPPGAGKSLVIAKIVQGLDAPCLVFQPSREILEQNANKLLAYGYTPSVYSASLRSRQVGDITLATIGSVKGRPELFDVFPYVIVDEAQGVDAQGGMYRTFFDALGEVRILGLTATPYRLSTDGYGGSMLKFLTRTRPRVFTDIVAYAQIAQLMEQGYLVRPDYHAVSGFTASEVQKNSTGADFDETALKRYYKRTGFAERLVRVVRRLQEIGRRHILVFTRFVEDAEALQASVPGLAVVSASTPARTRASLVHAFRAGEVSAVATVGVLSTGFDFPELDTVVLARPTVSLGLYVQQVGRVLRPHPSKASAWVVDMVDQVRQFGKLEELWLQPAGQHSGQWEVISRSGPTTRSLTNRYFDGQTPRKRPPFLRNR